MSEQTTETSIVAWTEQAINRREALALATLDINVKADLRAGGQAPAWSFRDDGSIWDANNVLRVRFTWQGEAQHIVANDPQDVLRSCARNRKLLDLHGGRGHSCPAYDYDGDLDENARFYNHEICPVVQNLAEAYGWTGESTT
ncbi:DUF6221 family protein [Streptomyces sp. NPDC090499]|uniref:DUF6221 family protein n=1 Tax=Streptomyces sp. NPDC090499 TaxID=3365965 RepID=UPI0038190692